MERSAFEKIYGELMSGLRPTLEIETSLGSFTRTFRLRERLVLLGGGHISKSLCHFASELGFSVTVIDDRPEYSAPERFPEAEETVCAPFPIAIARIGINAGDYVAVLTRGHQYDADCLRAILPGEMPYYLGMIGSQRRVKGLLSLLGSEGYDRSRLESICTPIGVSIGALTVDEIAISILAELIVHRRTDVERHSRSSRLVTEQADMDVIRSLADSETKKCVLIVLDTTGSTPVKSGAMMALDENYKTTGTVGGGCSENALLTDAYFLIGSGRETIIEVDMTNDVAASEGMVCGGRMKVLVSDVV